MTKLQACESMIVVTAKECVMEPPEDRCKRCRTTTAAIWKEIEDREIGGLYCEPCADLVMAGEIGVTAEELAKGLALAQNVRKLPPAGPGPNYTCRACQNTAPKDMVEFAAGSEWSTPPYGVGPFCMSCALYLATEAELARKPNYRLAKWRHEIGSLLQSEFQMLHHNTRLEIEAYFNETSGEVPVWPIPDSNEIMEQIRAKFNERRRPEPQPDCSDQT